MINRFAIAGYGEVGQALSKFYNKDVLIKDIDRDDGLYDLDVLNICFPYSDNFIDEVNKLIYYSQAKITIIHSTVAPGTTQAIGGRVCHSPCKGVHPNLYEGLKTFIKFIGSDNPAVGIEAQAHLRMLGFETELIYNSRTTELAKLLDTTYYGLCIAWHGEMRDMCEGEGVEWEDIIKYNKDYNVGYARLGLDKYVRPVLTPPEGGIGGHCVIPNAKILKNYYKSTALDFLMEYEKATP